MRSTPALPPIASASAPSRAQQRKLRRLVADALANVPFYRERYAEAGLTPADLADPQLLHRLPILTKADLLAAPLEQRRNRRLAPATLKVESTTGSTGQPFALYVDAAYRRKRNLRFLRALAGAGYRPWRSLMLLTDRLPRDTQRPGRRHYVAIEQPTTAIAEAYLRIEPDVLYGLATPLRLLAEHLLADPGRPWPRPRTVVSTAEMLDVPMRQSLEQAFGCPVLDFYGSTEMGLVAWQQRGAPGYLTSPSSTLVELVPAGHERCRLLLTNLDQRAAPVVRFDSGDLARVRETSGGLVIEAFEGRCIDTIVRRDGRELSPYRITDAFRGVPGVRRFRVVQRAIDTFHIELEADEPARGPAARAVEATLERLLGAGLAVEFAFSDALIEDGARKFRPVESRVPRS